MQLEWPDFNITIEGILRTQLAGSWTSAEYEFLHEASIIYLQLLVKGKSLGQKVEEANRFRSITKAGHH